MAKKQRGVAQNHTGGEFISAVQERRVDYEALRLRYQRLMARLDEYNDISDKDIIRKFESHAVYMRVLTGAFTAVANAYKKLHPATAPSIREAPAALDRAATADTPF